MLQLHVSAHSYEAVFGLLIYLFIQYLFGARGGVCLSTDAKKPVVSLEFFSDIILPAALWPWGRLSL